MSVTASTGGHRPCLSTLDISFILSTWKAPYLCASEPPACAAAPYPHSRPSPPACDNLGPSEAQHREGRGRQPGGEGQEAERERARNQQADPNFKQLLEEQAQPQQFAAGESHIPVLYYTEQKEHLVVEYLLICFCLFLFVSGLRAAGSHGLAHRHRRPCLSPPSSPALSLWRVTHALALSSRCQGEAVCGCRAEVRPWFPPVKNELSNEMTQHARAKPVTLEPVLTDVRRCPESVHRSAGGPAWMAPPHLTRSKSKRGLSPFRLAQAPVSDDSATL